MTSTYPPIYTRLSNFQRDANNGLESPAPAAVDAELNSIQLTLAQTVERLRAITSTDGRLRNVAQALAQSLVGSWTGTAPASPGPIVTTIPWVSTMSNMSVLVMVGSVPLRAGTFTVAAGGTGSAFLTITPAPYPTTGVAISVWAFEPGSGLLTRLNSTAAGDGATLVGIADTGNFYGATTVEGALAEVAGSLVALQTALGDLAAYFKADGSVAATADFDMAGNKITGAADGSADGDYVTIRQIATYIAAWTDLARFFLKRDGTTAMAGPLNFGNNKGYNLADPDLAQPLDVVNVRTLNKILATNGAAPVGQVALYALDTPPTGWLFCDGSCYLGTAYPLLFAGLNSTYKTGFAAGCQLAALPAVVAGNLTSGVLTGYPSQTLGAGYIGVPAIEVVNTDGGAVVTAQPTFSVSVTGTTTDGPNVTGGVLSISIAGGTGIREGAIIVVSTQLASSPTVSALAPLPSGYFRTPDLRGRVVVGAGTESNSPGVLDAPDVTKGDAYNATPRLVGAYGGEEKHSLTADENGRHNHPIYRGQTGGTVFDGGVMIRYMDGNPSRYALESKDWEKAGKGQAHNTMPPFHVLNYIIKAA